MDIRKIALHLSGKLPPEYIKFNRLEFMEYLEDIYGLSLEKIDFYWKQAKEYEEEFYFLVLDLLNKKAENDIQNENFNKLINRLTLPNEITGTNLVDFKTIESTWKSVNKESDPQVKGRLLEQFLIKLFNSSNELIVANHNLNNSDEEIDIVLKNNSNRPFLRNLNSPTILVEAKNWKDRVPTKVTRDFSLKSMLHSNLTRVGLFVSINGFTGEVSELLKRLGATNQILVLIEGSDIQNLIDNRLSILDWLEHLIIKSLK